MSEVRIALVCEGVQDQRFLTGIIKRTAERILQKPRRLIDVMDIEIIPRKQNVNQEENILNAAKEAYGRTLLVVHVDADSDTIAEAISNRIQPGLHLVQSTSAQEICKDIIPIIPRRMIENWILADKERLKENIGTDKTNQDLGITYPTNKVENIADPKKKIDEVIRSALSGQTGRKRKRQPIKRESLYEPKGRDLKLEVLAQLPSYQKFVKDLTDKFKELNFLH